MNNSKELDGLIAQMLKPLKGISLGVVVEGLSNCRILAFDNSNAEDVSVLNNLKKAAIIAGRNINKTGIVRPRPNEVGNDIEPHIKNALNKIGYEATTPLTKSGKKKSTGYPDIEFIDEFDRTNYLECKTFNIENIATTQRSFYLSPSDDFKVTKDAHHFVISFEIVVAGRKGRNNIYKCKSWKILTLENLEVDVKYEFNSDNARMYKKDIVIAEGRF